MAESVVNVLATNYKAMQEIIVQIEQVTAARLEFFRKRQKLESENARLQSQLVAWK